MAVAHQVIEGVDDIDRAGADGDRGPGPLLVVTIAEGVPTWLADAVAKAHLEGRRLAVQLVGSPGRTGAAGDGWEIGVITAAFTAGVDEVLGAAPQRVARVRTVVDRLREAAR